ncbi:c-type cytochrome [Alcaligenes aquatilis]|jgi:cytochrome c553|uniref:Cytochrome n=1 Tax=Alcaligenes aquatilis TaxID=323284 RepID=A0A3G2HX65_9BURK|nr:MULTISPECIES: c-type cytochrome [Alcaligenes]AYN21647.1 cytochrome [Alcaligenes aquatilis]MCC9161879.1 c-type cytochrome [Alcaligenes sp. MMA]MCH4223842.1 c-type cytochrome [Alcaligenes faecalis]QXR34946.1 c-type cytochrome [Alcaligenes aquatilis]UYY86258.1 c-type cytochrome [Alcaligenes sp. SMD-FA]
MRKTVLLVAMGLMVAGGGQAMAADDLVNAGGQAWKNLNCASCHGEDAKTPLNPEYPILAGQHADYLRQALMAYKRGQAGAPATSNIRKNAIMGAMANTMSQADIDSISVWLSRQPGPLSHRK